MPKLSTLTDAYIDDPMGSALPVVNPYFDPNQTKVIIPTGEEKPKIEEPSALSSNVDKILNSLFRDDENRLQLWPEKVIREALSGGKKVMSGEIPQWEVDPATGEVHTSPKMVETAQAISALAGTGGLAGTTEGTLGATPFLRPALKYKDKLYKGKEGQQHMDVIPEALYPEFQKMAMSGEDISHYNFGFVNDRGHFLDREKALKYAIDTGMVDKFAGQYGALTSTLLADSSKPGTAIEALAKTGGADPRHFQSLDAAKFRLGQLQRDKAATKKAGHDVDGSDYMFYNAQIRALKNYIKNPELFADSTKPGMAIEAMAKAKPEFKIKGFEDYNDWYHGTTHTFDKFDPKKGNPENYLGKAPHFTNSSKDASANYAGFGPDLTQRIEQMAEMYISNKKPDLRWGTEEYNKAYEVAKNKAKEKLAGEHEGAVIPANLKLENPISTVDHRPTWLNFSAKMDKNGEIIGESPLALKFYKSLQKQAKKYDFDPDKVIAGMSDHMYDEIKASTFDKALRNNEALMYAEDRKTGKLVSSDIISNIYKDMGFDGIVMDAKAAFPHMKDIPDGTLHAAPLKRNTVQSKITGQILYANGKPYVFTPVDYEPEFK